MAEDFYTRNKISIVGLSNERSPSRLLDNRSREKILRNAFLHFRHVRKWRGMELWSWVGAMTGHGSGYSQQICEELGWDYAMKIGPNATLPRVE